MLHLLLDCNVVSMSGVSTSVSSTLGYLLLFHPILEYPILRPRRAGAGGRQQEQLRSEEPLWEGKWGRRRHAAAAMPQCQSRENCRTIKDSLQTQITLPPSLSLYFSPGHMHTLGLHDLAQEQHSWRNKKSPLQVKPSVREEIGRTSGAAN